jgi:signal transduction histidine kinase
MAATERRGDRGRWAGLSLERKLPILIGGFLLLSTLALAVAGYLAVRRNALDAGAARVNSVSRQFRELFETQSAQMRAIAATEAARPPVVQYAGAPSPNRAGDALEALRAGETPRDAVLGSSIVSADARVRLSTVPESLDAPLRARELALARASVAGDATRIGRFHRLAGELAYAVVAPVPGIAGTFLVQWRRLGLSTRQRLQISTLLGSDAALLLGNADDSVWTDLERVIDEPRAYADATEEIRVHVHHGRRHIARAAPIAGTRWLVASEMPMDAVLEPVRRFAAQVGAITLVVLLAGLLGAWRVSRDITRPLTELTAGATAIARGEYAKVPRVDRHDELGRLSEAFAGMASEVALARTALEAKVEARTRDLEQTVAQLHDAQDALVRRERLATLGQLASGVGHELRNPLGVMTNAVYYLRAVLAQQPENVREYLDILSQQVAISEKIVADLLDFTRAKSPQRAPTALADVVAAQAAQLATAGFPEVAVEREVPAGLPPVLVDAGQAGQVVQNLLTNAAQAMGGRGTIHVRALHDVDVVHLEVRDHGTGIAPEHQARLFEPLFTTKARGIGLGLALSRTLARANGGDLAARNNDGRGATFTFTLPVAAPAGASA